MFGDIYDQFNVVHGILKIFHTVSSCEMYNIFYCTLLIYLIGWSLLEVIESLGFNHTKWNLQDYFELVLTMENNISGLIASISQLLGEC